MTPLEARREAPTNRPDRYVTVEVGDRVFQFRLPNEKRQFEILQFSVDFIPRTPSGTIDGYTLKMAMDGLEPAAAILGLCWFDAEWELEAAVPWPAIKEWRRLNRGATDEEQSAHRGNALSDFGEDVLEELDDIGYGSTATVMTLVGGVLTAIGRSFVSEEAIQKRSDFISPVPDTPDSSDSAVA